MSTQPNPAGRFAPQGSGGGDDLVFGDHPQSSLAIPKAVMAQLCAQVNDGARRLARGGLEVGGLLVGPKVRGARVVVDGIIPLPTEYRFGPFFQMSPSDLAGIAPAIESAQTDPSKTVVGFYRSRTRDDKRMRESDLEAFDAVAAAHPSFAADFRCCFILAPTSEVLALACIAMRKGAGWEEMPPITVRSSPPAILTFPSAAPPATHPLPTEERAIRLPVSSVIVQPAVERRGGARRVGTWMGVLCLMAAAAGGAYFWAIKNQPQPVPIVQSEPAPPPERLEFAAAFEGQVWRLSWDRAALEKSDPASAVLTIADGVVERQVALTAADLTNGFIFYTPQGGDLGFSLRADRGGIPVEEHVRVLGPPRIAPKLTPSPVSSSQVPVPAAAAPKAEPAAALPVATRPQANTIASIPDRDVQTTPAPVPQPIPQLNPQSTAPAAAATARPVVETPRVNRETPAAVTQSAAAPVIPPPAVITPPAVTPAAPPPVNTPAPLKATYVGPKPIRQVRPQIPANITSNVSQVQVMVEIDAQGKVTKVNPIAWSALNAPVMAQAVRAASSWLFDPAQSNGRAVASQMVLTFRMDNQAR